jgi:hypothetical protein
MSHSSIIRPGAPLAGTYLLKEADPALPNAQALNTVGAGLLKTDNTGAFVQAIPETDYWSPAGSVAQRYRNRQNAAGNLNFVPVPLANWNNVNNIAWKLEITNIQPDNPSSFIEMRYSSDGGATYPTTGYKWCRQRFDRTASGTFEGADHVSGTTGIALTDNSGDNRFANGVIYFYPFPNSPDNRGFMECHFQTADWTTPGLIRCYKTWVSAPKTLHELRLYVTGTTLLQYYYRIYTFRGINL